MLRYLTAGESHGQALVATLDGVPAHVRVSSTDIRRALARRRLGAGRGARMSFEADEVTMVAGLRHGDGQLRRAGARHGRMDDRDVEPVALAERGDPRQCRRHGSTLPLSPPPAGGQHDPRAGPPGS